MTIDLLVVGKTDSEAVRTLVEEYMRRINFHVKFSVVTIPDLKKKGRISPAEQKKEEGAMILKQLSPSDHVVLLDDKGSQFTSPEFAAWLEKRAAGGLKRLVFVTGGPYGFSDELYARAHERLSLSKMTFSHQIVRAIFAEQLYRAFSIIAGEPYHHE